MIQKVGGAEVTIDGDTRRRIAYNGRVHCWSCGHRGVWYEVGVRDDAGSRVYGCVCGSVFTLGVAPTDGRSEINLLVAALHLYVYDNS